MELPKRLRLWGIGGVGMSALAQHLLHTGHEITGYDRETSPQTEILVGLGIPIDFHPNPERLAAAEGVIYTPAILRTFRSGKLSGSATYLLGGEPQPWRKC